MTANKRLEMVLQDIIPSARVRGEMAMLDGINLLTVNAGQGPIPVRAQWIGTGWPQDVRRTLEAAEPGSQWPQDLILVARQFSPGAQELMESHRVSWADESGQARIVAPGLVVFREAQDRPKRPAAERSFAWSPSATGLAELLLSRPWPDGFGTTELANLSGWSPPQVSQVLQAFDDEGWTAKYGPRRGRGAKRELAEMDGLLESWTAALNGRPHSTREASATVGDVQGFLRDELAPALDEHVRWALTGWAAAQEVAPFVTTVPTLQIYVHEGDMTAGLEEVMRESGLRDVPEGGKVQFLLAPSEVLGRAWIHGGLPLASAPRIYADLHRLGPRGAEAAEHLKEEILDPLDRGDRQSLAPPPALVVWESETKARLQARIKVSSNEEIKDRYQHGTYSASYRLRGISEVPPLPQFKAILGESVGPETGWPAWLMPERPEPIDSTIEVWLDNTVFNDPSHSDFWRADPSGKMCLIRGYDEDGMHAPVPPGAVLDLTLPVWRVGECLLHARRLAAQMSATRIEFMMRWEGLAGRKVTSYASPNRMFSGEYRCRQDIVTTYVESTPARVDSELSELVRSLVAPLYAAFEFFEPPERLYEEELSRMRSQAGLPGRVM